MVDAKQFIQPTSRYREAAIKLLGEGKPGDTLTIEQIRAGIDAPDLPHEDLVRHIRSARNHLEKKSAAWWKWSKDFKGLICVDEKIAAPAMHTETRGIARKAAKALRRASCVDASKLTTDDRRQFDLSVAQAAMAKMSVSTKMGNAITKGGTFDPPKLESIAGLFKKA